MLHVSLYVPTRVLVVYRLYCVRRLVSPLCVHVFCHFSYLPPWVHSLFTLARPCNLPFILSTLSCVTSLCLCFLQCLLFTPGGTCPVGQEEHLRPCYHAIAVMTSTKKHNFDLMDMAWFGSVWHVATWAKQYSHRVTRASDMQAHEYFECELLPAKLSAKPGRKKRKAHTSLEEPDPALRHVRSQKCGLCDRYGHNRKGCTAPDINVICDNNRDGARREVQRSTLAPVLCYSTASCRLCPFLPFQTNHGYQHNSNRGGPRYTRTAAWCFDCGLRF